MIRFFPSWRRTSTRRSVSLATLLVVAAGMLIVPGSAQAGPTVAIGTINGQNATSGSVAAPVRGDVLSATGTADTRFGVLADAGASVAVPAGKPIPLTGIASFGTAPYRFAWSLSGATERFAAPTSQSTNFDTAGLEPGPVTVSLQVTDAEGNTDTDTVKLFLQGPVTSVLLDHQGPIGAGLPDETVSRTNTDGSTRVFDFAVPEASHKLVVSLDWSNPVNDLDLRVDDPSGYEDDNVEGATSEKPEEVSVDAPASGPWKAIVEPWANTPDTFTLKAVASGVIPDPTPRLDAGGPYRYEPGERQALSASLTGGTEPKSLAWDLDGDNRFEVQGATAVTDFPLGTHLVTVKGVDGAGYEKRETLSVRVVEAGAPSLAPGLVVVAIADSGVNPYHVDFRASSFPDQRILDATANFTRHPSEYLPGYPAGAKRLDVTLSDEYYPAADKVVDAEDTRTTLPEVEEDTLYWIPGTKIVGAYDSGSATFANSTAPDDIPILDENGHGTGSASVAVGNLYGFCPTCLLVVTEATETDWEYDAPWIDIASNSFGPPANAGFPGLEQPGFPRASAERGQLALYAAGNGNENAFLTPEQTYTSPYLGPHWTTRVGAVTTGSRKPIIGTGKPVDIASFGSGNIPAADPESVKGLGSHGGTSAATPYSAGVFGSVLRAIREKLEDPGVGQRPAAGQGVIATGVPLRTSPYLFDGLLTRTELVEAIFKTAAHDQSLDSIDIYPPTAPPTEFQHAFEGYGIVEPASGARALAVLLGSMALPERPAEDEFFAEDERIRDELWGDWAGGGANSSLDPGAPEVTPAPDPLAGKTFAAAVTSPRNNAVIDPRTAPVAPVRGVSVFPPHAGVAVSPARFYPHRRPSSGTQCRSTDPTVTIPLVESMDRVDSEGDCEVGYNFQATGIQPSEEYQSVENGLVFGNGNASGIIYVRETLAASPAHELTIALKGLAGGEPVELGSVTVSKAVVAGEPTEFPFSIPVPAHLVGVAIDRLTLSVFISRSTSLVSRTALNKPFSSFVDLPLASPGAVPARSVELSVDDASFATPVVAQVSADGASFTGAIDTTALVDGPHTLYARARQASAVSEVTTRTFEIRRSVSGPTGTPEVEAQITPAGGAPAADRWVAVTDTSGAGTYATWSVQLPIATLAPGSYLLQTRVLDKHSIEVASDTAAFSIAGPATGTSGSSTADPGTTDTARPAPAAGTPGEPPRSSPSSRGTAGYWMLDQAGHVYGFGAAGHHGNPPVGAARAVDLESTPSAGGYWVTDHLGHVFAFGDAPYLGGLATPLNRGEEVTSISATPSGLGYRLFTNRGRVIVFGDAPFLGDMAATRLNGPVLDSVSTPTGRGYYMVAADGGIFTFGDAVFRGSMGSTRLNAPVQSLVPDVDGDGYWLVAADGGIFSFDAPFRGSMGSTRLNQPVSGMVRYGNGYLMVAEDGGIFNFSDTEFLGSLGSNPPPNPVVSVAAAVS